MTFFIVLFLLLMQFLWRYIDELVGKGLGFSVIGELLAYASSSLVPLALPLAILLSSLMTFGNMGEFYELTAMKSSGISLRRIMYPLIFLVALISVGAFFFANNVLPVTNLKMKSLLYDVRNQRPEVQIMEGIFYNGIDNYSIRINRKDPATNMLYDIKIYDHSSHKGNVSVIIADSGRMKITDDRRNLMVTLWSGYKYTELEERRRRRDRSFPHELDKFGEQRIIIEMSGFDLNRSDESIFRNSYAMLNVSQLGRARDSLRADLKLKSKAFFETLIRNNYFKLSKRFMNTPPSFASTTNTYVPPAIQSARSPITPPSSGVVKPPPPSSGQAAHLPRTTGNNSASARPREPRPRPSAPPDSVVIPAPPVRPVLRTHNFDSLFNAYSRPLKIDVIRTAKSYASMAQYLVTSTSTNVTFDKRFLRRHEIEWHRKFTLSIACLIFLFIGAPLGAIIRKGGLGMPTVISTLLFILYYIISLTGEKFVRESVVSSMVGMWFSSFVLIIAGVFLTYEATNDSAILNLDSYLNWIRDRLGLKKGVLLESKSHLTGKFDLIDIPRQELQEEFSTIGRQALRCREQFKKERLLTLTRKVIKNTGYIDLIEFGADYNSLIDRIVLSKWFRNEYFRKRLGEFPYENGRITAGIFPHRWLRTLSFIVFPSWIFIMLHLWVKSLRLRQNLFRISELSAGMVNLLNSAAIRTDQDLQE
jgi:lipopolysaccharide export system permease protein